MEDLPLDQQLEKLSAEEVANIYAYPTENAIRTTFDIATYTNRPFTQRLALAEHQLQVVFFDLNVLEFYYNDPRYVFDFRDYHGKIHLHAENSDSLPRDSIALRSFGIGYNNKKERVVAAFLRYLNELTPEHQQIWNAHIITDHCSINSDYKRIIQGLYPQYCSVYRAFLQEQVEINELCRLIGKPPLFRATFIEKRPTGFHAMLRPTLTNFEQFIHTLDKMLSDNINRDFFKGDIPLEDENVRKDNRIVAIPVGTLLLLERWIHKMYRRGDGVDASAELLALLKEVRKLRQKPAHQLQANEFNYKYPKDQDELLQKVCLSLTQLRLMFQSHPQAKSQYSPPEWLDSGKIVFY